MAIYGDLSSNIHCIIFGDAGEDSVGEEKSKLPWVPETFHGRFPVSRKS